MQVFLRTYKGDYYSSLSFVVCISLPLSLVFLYFAYRCLTFYKANLLFTLSLFITNGLAIFLYSLSIIGLLVTSKALINSNDPNPVNAYDSLVIA